MNITTRYTTAIIILLAISSFQQVKTLQGTWEYSGGIFNGKPEGKPKGYKQQRKYTGLKFDSYVIEKGEKTQKYESGNYMLTGDTCLETQTYSMQPSKLKGITVHYLYAIRNDTLFLKAILPNGFVEEDYWKKVK